MAFYDDPLSENRPHAPAGLAPADATGCPENVSRAGLPVPRRRARRARLRSTPAAERSRAVSRLEALIGDTPLIELPAWGPRGVLLLAKAEHLNPGGSVKDRAALAIVRAAEASGELAPGRVLLDASSGNTGIAYAMLCAARGCEVEICLPRNASPERKHLLHAYGAAVVETDPLEGAEGAVREARRRAALDPERYCYADQYNNPANRLVHYETTGPEIWRQTGGRVTHWVAGLGTTGTFTGTARRLSELNPAVRRIAVQPDAPFHGLEGMKHLASSTVPSIYEPELVDEVLEVGTEEAQATARRLAREAGLLVGVSSGANVAAAVRVARRLERGVVVTVLCDGGDRYLSHAFWKEGDRAAAGRGRERPAAASGAERTGAAGEGER